jgi:hypothetical protein
MNSLGLRDGFRFQFRVLWTQAVNFAATVASLASKMFIRVSKVSLLSVAFAGRVIGACVCVCVRVSSNVLIFTGSAICRRPLGVGGGGGRGWGGDAGGPPPRASYCSTSSTKVGPLMLPYTVKVALGGWGTPPTPPQGWGGVGVGGVSPLPRTPPHPPPSHPHTCRGIGGFHLDVVFVVCFLWHCPCAGVLSPVGPR